MNATHFLSVLAGDSDAMQGIGSGRVVASGPHDKVFVYYTDHGASGDPPATFLFVQTRLLQLSCSCIVPRRSKPLCFLNRLQLCASVIDSQCVLAQLVHTSYPSQVHGSDSPHACE